MLQRFVRMKCNSLFLTLLVLALAGAARAQVGQLKNLSDAMQKQGIPSTISVAQLTAGWRLLLVGNPETRFPEVFDSNAGGQALYYSNGNIFSDNGQQYLVAYRLLESPDPDQRAVQQYYVDKYYAAREDCQGGAEGSCPDQSDGSLQRSTPPLLKDSRLALSPLPLGHTQILNEIKQFDPAMDVVTVPSKTLFERRISQSNLKQIARAVFLYAGDYKGAYPPMIASRDGSNFVPPSPSSTPDDTLPPPTSSTFSASPGPPVASSPKTVQDYLMLYINSQIFFVQPVTQRPYLPNYKISRKTVAGIKNPSQTFLFYEDAPDADDGMRNVVYADGHVVALTEAQFQKQRIAQGISASGYPPVAKLRSKVKAAPRPVDEDAAP